MKILFAPRGCTSFHANSLSERPLGGIETAVIRLAAALEKLGHEVIVLSGLENPPASKPVYITLGALREIGEVDVLIAVRELFFAFTGIRAKRKFFWTGDSYDLPFHIGLGDRRSLEQLSGFLAVSNWQAEKVCAVSGFPIERTHLLPNGVALELFEGTETRNHHRLIYTSTPFRGLAHLTRLFPTIRSAVPDAELHVFSGFDVYKGSGFDLSFFEREFEPVLQAARALEGCTVHGNVPQAQLAREYMRSAVLAYPNTFEETFCISAVEAQAGGCVAVTSARAALGDTVGKAGVFIEGEPGTDGYDSTFTENVIRLLTDEAYWKSFSDQALNKAQQSSWARVAENFSALLQDTVK